MYIYIQLSRYANTGLLFGPSGSRKILDGPKSFLRVLRDAGFPEARGVLRIV